MVCPRPRSARLLEGRGHWFTTREAAAAFVRQQAGAGIDIGCFQINTRWHGDAFASIEAMLDPVANADHAAAFLARLHAEFGDWEVAAGAYHSRTPGLAEAYRRRFFAALAELVPEHPAQTAADAAATRPAFAVPTPSRARGASARADAGPEHPLLRAADPGQAGVLGSLVVLSGATPVQPLIRATAAALR